MIKMFREIYQYRQLLRSCVVKDVKGKYKNAFLGIMWSFLTPLLSACVYAIVFPIVLKNSEPHYATFLIIGLIPWTYFANTIAVGTVSILENAGIVKKVYFPREILLFSVNISGLINFLISLIIIVIFLLFSHIGFSMYMLFLPLIILTQFILQQAIIFITSAIEIYIRDAQYIIGFIINMLFYATPILYSAAMFENTQYSFLLYINPLVPIFNCYKDILYYQNMPHLKSLLAVLGFSIFLFYIGFIIYKKFEKGFVEEI